MEGCEKRQHTRGACHAHYSYFLRHGLLDQLPRAKKSERLKCIADGCETMRNGVGWCKKHHAQFVSRPRAKEKRRQEMARLRAAGPQLDQGLRDYITDRRRRNVPQEGLPTYTLLPLVAQIEAIEAMAG